MALKFTNKHNLPESFVNAVLVDEHISLGDISVTQLIDAPQIRMLKKNHDYTMDIMDMIGMVMGTGMHTVLERGDLKGTFNARVLQRAIGVLLELEEDKAAGYLEKVIADKLQENIDDDIIVEQTLTIEILGWTISGTFDRYKKALKELQDYKQTGASSVMFPETKKSWNAQLNIYACMLRANGFEVDKATIIAVIKDWSKMKIMTSKDYPKTPVIMHSVDLIENDRVLKFLESRVKLHQRAQNGEHIPCTPKDRWAKPNVWAVKKKGGKRAAKLCLTEKDAEVYIAKNKDKITGDFVIEFRRGESFRCAQGYCSVSDFCPQYAEEKRLASEEADKM